MKDELTIFGVRLVGMTHETGVKLGLTIALIAGVLFFGWAIGRIVRAAFRGTEHERGRFWSRQIVRLVAAAVLLFGVLSIWFENPERLAGAVGLITAGIAIALQRVITSFAGYLIILRGKIFTVGDRITMGGVRGDVIALSFMQTTVMEMGQSPAEQTDDPAVWVRSRQYTGRLVNITNDRIFETPIYNYSREFPFLWEEIHLGIKYADDWQRAEAILLETAKRNTAKFVEEATAGLERLRDLYPLRDPVELEPRVYIRLTDNWVDLSVRFLSGVSGNRGLKDRMSRDILAGLAEAEIEIASTTYEITGLPAVELRAGRELAALLQQRGGNGSAMRPGSQEGDRG